MYKLLTQVLKDYLCKKFIYVKKKKKKFISLCIKKNEEKNSYLFKI